MRNMGRNKRGHSGRHNFPLSANVKFQLPLDQIRPLLMRVAVFRQINSCFVLPAILKESARLKLSRRQTFATASCARKESRRPMMRLRRARSCSRESCAWRRGATLRQKKQERNKRRENCHAQHDQPGFDRKRDIVGKITPIDQYEDDSNRRQGPRRDH